MNDVRKMHESHWFCPKCGLTENGLVDCIDCKQLRIFEYVCRCGCHESQSKPIEKMPCPKCKSIDTELRLPRDTSKKESKLICKSCNYVEVFP